VVTHNYLNKDNLLRLAKYAIGFFVMYAVTIHYVIRERDKPNFHITIAAALIIMCCLVSWPLLKEAMKVFFEKIVMTETEISFHHNFRKTVIPWNRVQYFIRLPSRGFFAGLIIYYEMGDFKKKVRFESTITNRDQLITFIQSHVGKLRKVRRTFR